MRRFLSLTGGIAAIALATFTTPAPASAQTLALDFTGGNSVFTGVNSMRGWAFTVNSTITLVEVGIFDTGANGLVENHRVGIWDIGGTLLLSEVVLRPVATNTVGSISGSGNWRFQAITPLALGAGTYIIGGFYSGNAFESYFINAATAPTAPQVTWAGAVHDISGNFTRPTNPSGGIGNFGPNFRFTAGGQPAAPEPGTLALLGAGMGLGWMGRNFRGRWT